VRELRGSAASASAWTYWMIVVETNSVRNMRSATMVTRLSSRFIRRSPASDGCAPCRTAAAAAPR
jgi:hypothetical protein